jgi:hypothetical protein
MEIELDSIVSIIAQTLRQLVETKRESQTIAAILCSADKMSWAGQSSMVLR